MSSKLKKFKRSDLIPSFSLFLKRNIGNIFIAVGLFYILIGFYPVIHAEVSFYLLENFPSIFRQETPTTLTESQLEETKTLWEDLESPPINTEFSIVIPKLNVNSPIVSNVSVWNESEYLDALQNGVAHAEMTANPSTDIGNTFLFAHSTPNIFDIQKYSAVFTLLHKLETGDRVIIFHQNKRYDYTIKSNDVVEAFNLNPLTKEVDVPTLTLQTCDPPGIPINRRIVTAELVEVAK